MMKSSDEDGRETAKISVSTGTIGGGAPAASEDDPPDKETFQVETAIEHNTKDSSAVLFGQSYSSVTAVVVRFGFGSQTHLHLHIFANNRETLIISIFNNNINLPRQSL